MGMVFLGRDVALDRPVAIKIIRPDLATAAAAERFVREARILASLRHPNVVPVHRAGEAGGFSYYVMDYLAAETLADRLARGPLAPAEALALGRDLLAALVVAHSQGILHRDVKPANIFLLEGRAVLGDFGIAKSASHGGEALTQPGAAIGTPDYMAPEQATGQQVTATADVYSAGLVLFEALTARRWPSFEEPERGDWTRVPRAVVPVLQRALALSPAARWPDAAAFRRALARTETSARTRWALAAGGGLAVAAAAVALLLPGRAGGAPESGARQVTIQSFRVAGSGAPAWLGDSLAWMLHRALGASTDFRVRLAAGGASADAAAGLVLDGLASVRGDTLAVAVTSSAGAAGGAAFRAETTGTVADWPRAADDLAYQVLWQIWRGAYPPLAEDLPLRALPRHNVEALRAFLGAERMFARAQWRAAYEAYQRAAEQDRSCLLCLVRIRDVGRWLGKEPDTSDTYRYRAALDSFPPHYQRLIEASFAPHGRRFELLRALTEDQYRSWGFGWFVRADEIFHRGPFDGYRRAAALQLFQRARDLRPDFAPIWEHLAWAAIAEGDSAEAAHALASYAGLVAQADPAAATVYAMLLTAFQWRFLPEVAAVAFSMAMLARPDIAVSAELVAAPSEILTLDVPRATLWLGEQFALGRPRPGLEAFGLLAQVHALVALGRLDSALVVGRHLTMRSPEPAIALFVAELPAAFALADSADVAGRWASLAGPLEPIAAGRTRATSAERARASWMLALLAWRAHRGDEGDSYRHAVERLERPGAPLGLMLGVEAGAATHGVPSLAVARSDALVDLDSANRGGDPFFRALLHLDRAQWHLSARDAEAAVRELRWHENNDFAGGYPGLVPQAGEVDQAFGTLARWRRARLLEGLGHRGDDEELCGAYAAVARLWRDGDVRYAARADSAAQRRHTLGCPPAR